MSIHLSEFIQAGAEDSDYDSYGEDIAETESDESGDYDSEEDSEDDFIGESNMFPQSPMPNCGLVIAEIIDDEKPESENGKPKQLRMRKQSAKPNNDSNSKRQLVVRGSSGVPLLESEDDDGFPIDSSCVKEPNDEKSEVDPVNNFSEEGENKNKRKKDEAEEVDGRLKGSEEHVNEVTPDEKLKRDKSSNTDEGISEENPKKKKKKINKDQVTDKKRVELQIA